MAKAIALYRGNITPVIEKAIRSDGTMFRRHKKQTAYGPKWSAWEATGEHVRVDGSFIPEPALSARICILSLVDRNSRFKAHRDMFRPDGGLRIRLPD